MNYRKEKSFKQTEMGLIPKNWEVRKLYDVININPIRDLAIGNFAKYIPMDSLEPFTKNIKYFLNKKYHRGPKFINKDTIMAKITPCLENGKTAFISSLEDKEVAFGSSEFIVFSKKEDISNSEYIFYKIVSQDFREIAIQSMTGTSGRQRVQLDIIKNLLISIPNLEEQKVIGNVLKSLDDKIELNNQINQNLEKIAQSIFKHWFIDFEFPDENNHNLPYKSSGGEMVDSELGKIPKWWKIKKLGEIINIFDSRRIPLSSREREKRKGVFPYCGATGIIDYINSYIFEGTYVLVGEDGSVIKENDKPYTQYINGKFWVNNHAHVIQGKGNFSTEYIKIIFDNINIKPYITGAVQPKLNQENLLNIKIILPSLKCLTMFNTFIIALYKMIIFNDQMADVLSRIRDSLIPKLMTGKIRVNIENEDNQDNENA